ncbi:hypothetical protein FRC04_002336 [Tulasnella sp. 424]|nr:hypothetical protein FRC04_002336 [Tulasnella sp. 424]
MRYYHVAGEYLFETRPIILVDIPSSVFVLERLTDENMRAILERTLQKVVPNSHSEPPRAGTPEPPASSPLTTDRLHSVSDNILNAIVRYSQGDARTALSLLELAINAPPSTNEETLLKNLKKSVVARFDRTGDDHYDMISALHKSVRGSDGSAAMYWLARMLTAGEDPLYIARRCIVMASEDIGLANDRALPMAIAAYNACQIIGMPECRINLAHLVAYLAESPKSTRSYEAYNRAEEAAKEDPAIPVPLNICNAPTGLMKELGYGRGYLYNPSYAHPVHNDFLPLQYKQERFLREEGDVEVQQKAGWDVTTVVAPLSYPPIQYHVADPAAIKFMTGNRVLFPKPIEMYDLLMLYGDNLLTTEGETWSRHRRLANPSFAETSIRYVWEQTLRILDEMCDDWGEDSTKEIPHMAELTKEITLLILGAVAFGQETHWESGPGIPPDGHKMTFRQAVGIVSERLPLRVALPSWLWGNKETRDRMGSGGIASWGWLGSTIRDSAIGYAELQQYMEEMMEEQSKVGFEGRRDIFSQLVQATGEDVHDRLSTKDVIGNTFIFLIAGHETTAHATAYLFGLLALEQETQDELYDHIIAVLGDKQPTYEDIPRLDLVLAAFYEALRMYPPVLNIPKRATEDTSIPVMPAVRDNGDQIDPLAKPQSLFVPKGTEFIMYTGSLHYNPRYWKEPYSFKPKRFLESDWPRDAFIPFSSGARACIGRRFAEVECIGMISMLLKRFRITVDENRFPTILNETPLARRERLFESFQALSLTPKRIPLVFTRR